MRIRVVIASGLVALALAPAVARADVQTIAFDDLAVGTTVATQYPGVTFQLPPESRNPPVVRSAPGLAHSGAQVVDITTCPGGCGEDYSAPRSLARLTNTASAVSIYAGDLTGGGAEGQVALRAYDANGQVIADTGMKPVTGGAPFATKLEVTSPTPNIAAFDVISIGGTPEQIGYDDLAITYPDAPQPADFALDQGNTVVEVLQKTSVDVPVDLTRLNGSNGDIAFSVSGVPDGMSASFAPNPVTATDTHTTLTLTAAEGAAAQTDYATITIVATPAGAAVGPAPRTIRKLVRIRENCDKTVSFQYIDARATGCMLRQANKHTAINTDVRINGLILKPLDNERALVIDDQAKTIKSFGLSTFAVAIDAEPDIPIYYGPIDWDFSAGGTGPHEVVGFNAVNAVNKLKGLPLSGLKLAFTPEQRTRITPTLKLDFWPFNYLGALTASAQFTASNDHGANFTGLELKVAKLEAVAITLKDVSLRWQDGESWGGSATVVLNFAKKLTVSAGFGIDHGDFKSLSASVGNLNTAIGTGIYLQSLGFAVERNPLTLRGSIGLSGGPAVAGKTAVSVGGQLSAVLADPFVIEVTGNAKLADRFQIGSAYLRYSSWGLFEFGGAVDWDFKIIYVKGKVDGWVAGLDAFDVEGSISGCLRVKYLPDPCAGAHALVSSIGIAGCLEVYGYGAGAAATWGGDFDAFTGCDLSPWRPAKPTARAAVAGDLGSVTLPRGLPSAAWEVQGIGDAPGVTLTGPHGERVAVSRDVPFVRRGAFTAALQEDDATVVYVRRPAAGRWHLSTEGSVAVKGVRYARGLPEPSVHARVTRRAGKRTLRWRLRPQPGQRVRFVEIGKDVRHVLATARAARGAVRLRPARGPAGLRRVVAIVEQSGRPRARLTVATFRASAPPRPLRPARLKVVRRQTRLIVSWRPRPAGLRHAVHLSLSDGRELLRVVSGKQHSATITGVPRTTAAKIAVRGLTDGNARGPAAFTSVKAASR